MSESTLRCPGCGAPCNTDDASCAYCGSALATVNCASCFAPMFAGSRFCARCGAEVRREVVDEETTLKCPRCRESMQALRLGETMLHECSACGGLWLDPESLQKLSDRREQHADVVSLLATHVPTLATPPDAVRYVPCPRCDKLMNRKNFAQSSGIILDVCAKHGVWLDRGELERVLGFVESGGLARARARELARLQEEQRRLAALQKLTPSHGVGVGVGVGVDLNAYAQRDATWMPSTAHATLGRLLLDALDIVIT